MLCFILSLCGSHSAKAQISSPGLGEARSAIWSAIGLRTHLDTLGKKESLTYLGWGRKSDQNRMNPVANQAIWVLNHEVYHKFAPHQQYSYALSYRRQTAYNEEAPFEREGIEQEFRLYGRYAYSFPLAKRWTWKNTIRQEFRKFFRSDFGSTPENFQFRTRIKSQVSYSLSEVKKRSLMFSVEELFAISRMADRWTSYQDKETRVGLYYRFKWKHLPIETDIGYANDFIRGFNSGVGGVHYLSWDMIWNL